MLGESTIAHNLGLVRSRIAEAAVPGGEKPRRNHARSGDQDDRPGANTRGI